MRGSSKFISCDRSAAASLAKISIAADAGKSLAFAFPPVKSSGVEAWGLRLNRAQLQALATRPELEPAEAFLGTEGHWLTRSTRLSVEGFPNALAALAATCPPRGGNETIPVHTVRVQSGPEK